MREAKNSYQPESIPSVWDDVAGEYASIDWNAVDHKANLEIIFKLFGDLGGKKVCEVGCGAGVMSSILASRGALVTLVDISQKSLGFAEDFFQRSGLQAQFVLCDALDMPLENESYDIVWNAGVIEHFFDDGKIKLLREMMRLVKPGGKMILFVPNSLDFPFMVGKWIRKLTGKWIYGYEDDMSPRRLRRLAYHGGLIDATAFAFNPVVGWWFVGLKGLTMKLGLHTVDWHARLSPFGHCSVLVVDKR